MHRPWSVRRVDLVGLLLMSSLLTAAGCKGDDDDPGDDDDATDDDDDDNGDDDDTVGDDYGTVDDCSMPDGGSFNDFYVDGDAVLVHGTSERDEALAQQVEEWYGELFATFDVVSADELTQGDRARNLFIIGAPASNTLLVELNGSLPVWFDDGQFVFGGYRYADHGHGIALIHPSPFAEGKYVLVYAGNSVDGAFATFTVYTGGEDYQTVRGNHTLQQEGSLCRTGDAWKFYDGYDTDLRQAWDQWVDSLGDVASEHFEIYYVLNGYASDNLAWLASNQEAAYEHVIASLGVAGLDDPIRMYLYPDNKTKGEVTGDDGNAHANYLNFEMHNVYGEQVQSVGPHEVVHIVAWHRIGATHFALMGEGLAVMVSGDWQGQPLESWVSQFQANGNLPSLEELISQFGALDDGISYPTAGHFVSYLVTTYGMDTVKRLYTARDLHSAFQGEFGLTVEELETAWLTTIP